MLCWPVPSSHTPQPDADDDDDDEDDDAIDDDDDEDDDDAADQPSSKSSLTGHEYSSKNYNYDNHQG